MICKSCGADLPQSGFIQIVTDWNRGKPTLDPDTGYCDKACVRDHFVKIPMTEWTVLVPVT